MLARRARASTEDELKDYVKANLARYKVPREVEFLDELPRNATGKVLKRELAERELMADPRPPHPRARAPRRRIATAPMGPGRPALFPFGPRRPACTARAHAGTRAADSTDLVVDSSRSWRSSRPSAGATGLGFALVLSPAVFACSSPRARSWGDGARARAQRARALRRAPAPGRGVGRRSGRSWSPRCPGRCAASSCYARCRSRRCRSRSASP